MSRGSESADRRIRGVVWMKRPRLYHKQCPAVRVGDNNPEMAVFSDESVVFVDAEDTNKLIVRIPFVCPECGFVVEVDF